MYVTTKRKRFLDVNVKIQQKINEMYPSARSYFRPMPPKEESLQKAIYYAESQNWLVIINTVNSSVEHLKELIPNKIMNISYQEGDFSSQYGEKAKSGYVTVQVRN